MFLFKRNPLKGKSIPWLDGYFAKGETHPQYLPVVNCPYDEVSQWESAQEWHLGYLYREEHDDD